MTSGAAAEWLGVTPQTVRNLLGRQKLRGNQGDRGRWRVETASLEDYLAEHGRKNEVHPTGDLQREIKQLAAGVSELRSSEAMSARHVESLEQERDHYRADAAAAREAALMLISAAREVDGAVRQTLRVLELQTDALVQLLAPGSPGDLLP